MPRALIAGCGYAGKATADLLFTRDWQVEGWTQSEESAQECAAGPYPVRAVDISNAAEMANYKNDFDAVIHCASTRGGDVDLYQQIYLRGAVNLLERFKRSRMIFTSSTSVYAQTDGSWVTEESVTEPSRETGRILLETEKLVLASGGTVARLAGIYGPGRSALLRKFLSGEAVIDPENDRFVNQVHRDDIASALALLLDRQSNGGEIYNVVDDEPIRRSDCYKWLARKLNRPLPSNAKSTSGRKRGDSNKRVSNAKLRGLGWKPRYHNFAEAMENSVLPSFADLISEATGGQPLGEDRSLPV
jgi:nucleoside-diphosphate-sugar epimerase